MEIDISCLLREPACHLLHLTLGKLSCKPIFGRGMAKHLPYISLLKFGNCLQVSSSPPRLTAALITATLGEPHGYTWRYGRMGSNMHQNSLFAPVQRLYLAGSPGTWIKRICSIPTLPSIRRWMKLSPKSESKETFPRDLCCFYISSMH